MLLRTKADALRLDVFEDRALRWLSVLGLSLAILTTLAALALSMCASHPLATL